MDASSFNTGVLLVDQDRDTRERVARQLAAQGISVTTCEEGRQALAVALTCPHDVIVTDAQLPGLDGFELCRLLRQDAATHRTPIVVITDDDTAGVREQASRAGATSVLARVSVPDALLAAVRTLCGAAHRSTAVARESVATLRKGRPLFMSRLFARHATTTPPVRPPVLRCPECERPLAYQRSHVGGVSHRHPEQWDDFDCLHGCGSFEFRHRTKRLRAVI